MLKKVLVVGGAGYIGGGVTDLLLEKKIPFTVYDNLTYENHYLKPLDFIYGDVRDQKKLQKLFGEYSHVIWLAAIVGDGASSINPQLTKEVNQDSVAFLSKQFKGRILFTSTCSVYGANNEPVHEESATNPLSVYAQTKLEAETFLEGKNALILRLGTAFGLSDTYSRIRMDLAINYMTMNAIKYGKLHVFGGNQWRPFAHVKDIAHVLVASLDKENTGIYNFATQNETIATVANMIKKQTDCKIEVTEQKFEDERNYHADLTKGIRDEIFSQKAKHTIIDGIREVKELVLSNRIKNLDLEFYSNEKHLLASMTAYENSYLKGVSLK